MFVSGPSFFTRVVAYTCLPEATVPKLQNQQSATAPIASWITLTLGGQLIRLRTGGARDTRVVSTRRQHLTRKTVVHCTIPLNETENVPPTSRISMWVLVPSGSGSVGRSRGSSLTSCPIAHAVMNFVNVSTQQECVCVNTSKMQVVR